MSEFVDQILFEGLNDEIHPEDILDEIGNIATSLFNVTTEDYLGAGGNGIAYKYQNKTLKITTNDEEISLFKQIKNKSLKHFVTVYSIKKIPKDWAGFVKNKFKYYDFYAIIKEYVEPLNNKEINTENFQVQYKELKQEIVSTFGGSAGQYDLGYGNLGWKKDGTLAAFDL